MPQLFMVMLVLTALALTVLAGVVAFGLGALGGVACTFGLAWTTLAGRGRDRPALVLPAHVVAGTAGLPRARGTYRRDRAWPGYLVGQWRHDWAFFQRNCRALVQRGYGGIADRQVDFQAYPLHSLVTAVALLGCTGAAGGVLVGGALLTAGCAVALVPAAVGWGCLIGVLRGYDGALRRVRRADAVCPHPQCYYRQRVPNYRCSKCGAVHRDIRPGLLGAVWRRCDCGTTLPTTVLRAARQLSAWCKRCDGELHRGSAEETSVVLPVFGPVSAGKSRLVRFGLRALHEELTAAGAEVRFPDEPSRQAFEDGTVLLTGGDTVKTPRQHPPAITARIGSGRKRARLSLFDAAGELFADRADTVELEFLDHAGGLLFVVDPFSMPWVQDQLGGPQDERVLRARPAGTAPEEVYQVTVRRLKDHRVRLDRRSIAVVVVKADLLPDAAWSAPLLAGDVRGWLLAAGQDNLVLAAERDFRRCGFFGTASTGDAPRGALCGPADPLRWLVHRTGFRLPKPPRVPEVVA